ncbi:hypothetical protein ACFLWA_00690 [Chloroflexota bacterium]
MKSRTPLSNPRWPGSLAIGASVALMLLLAGVLLMTLPVAATNAMDQALMVGQDFPTQSSSVLAGPGHVELTADPTLIPPNGLSFSTLTAVVSDTLGDPVDDGTVVVFSTTLGTFAGGLTITPEPTGVMTVEAEGGEVISVGTWITYSNGDCSNGKGVYSNNEDDEVTYTFTGTGVSVLFQKDFNTGIAHVYVDGDLYREIDTYSAAALCPQEELIAEDLPYAEHEVQVVVSGLKHGDSAGTYLDVDAIRAEGVDRNGAYLTSGGVASVTLTSTLASGIADVTASANPSDSTQVAFDWPPPQTLILTALPQRILADGASTSMLSADVMDLLGDPVPDGTVVVFTTTLGTFPGALTTTPKPTGETTVEAEGSEVTRPGSWTEYDNGDCSNGKGVYSNNLDAEVAYTFTGTGVFVLFQKDFNTGIAHVYVDGDLYREIDTYSAGALCPQEELIVEDMPYAEHEVRVVVSGLKHGDSAGTYLAVDAIRVEGVDRNGAYLTSGGVASVDLTSSATPGTAQVTACAGPACDGEPVYFSLFHYLPVVKKTGAPPPPPDCEDLIENGGFEDNSAWNVGSTPRPARYTDERAHSGSRSALLGLKPGEADVRSYSSVRQTITLPPTFDSATLTFWYYPVSDEDDGDRQETLLLDENDDLIAVLMRTNSNDATWKQMSFDLSAYAGQTFKVYFNAFNDGDASGVAGFYLDDVSVQLCPPGAPVPPPDCFSKLLAAPGVGDAPHGVAVNSAANLIYVANHKDHTLTTMNGSTYGVIRTVPVGDGPNGVAYNPTNDQVYVANRNDSTVSVLSADGATVVKTIDVDWLPDGVAVNKDTNRIYVANYGSNTVSVIDGASNTVSQTLAVGSAPAMIAVNHLTNKAYVSLNNGPGVAVIDGAGTVTPVDLFDSEGPYGIAVDTVRNLVYVATIDTARIVVLDGSDDSYEGWAEFRRLGDDSLAPLRMVAVNPSIGTSGHLFATTASVDGGWNKFLLIPKGWPEYFARPYALDLKGPREGIAFEPSTLRVFVPSRRDDLLAVYLDGEPVCPQNFTSSVDYEVSVCVAGADGTCKATYTR